MEEAHDYFKKAYDILQSKEELSKTDDNILIDLLNSWGYAFYYLGEFGKFIDLFNSHLNTAASLEDNTKIGMFYAWLGIGQYMVGSPKVSYKYLCKGLEIGEKIDDQKVVGYACAWLTFTCGELGYFSEGIQHGERAQEIAKSFPADQYLFFKSLGGLCYIYYFKGDTNEVFEGAKRLIEYGEVYANSRSKVFGHFFKALGHLAEGDFRSAQETSKFAMKIATEPFYAMHLLFTLALSYLFDSQFQEAENCLKDGINYCEKTGIGQFLVLCQIFLAPVLFAKGSMQQGNELMKKACETLKSRQRNTIFAISEYILGEVNSQIATGPKPSLSIIAKNIGFLMKNVPSAGKKAEEHFNKAIELLKEIGMKGFLGQAYFGMGMLYKATKRTGQARQYVLDAIDIFKECEAEGYLKQANEVLDSLG